MLDLRTQTQFADATAAMMRTCAIAATNAMAQSAYQGLSFWSDMMRVAAPARSAMPGMSFAPAYWTAFARMTPWTPAWPSQPAPRARAPGAPSPPQPAADGGYASYRSAGGHASAQVVIAPEK